jgi:hypothetical protein
MNVFRERSRWAGSSPLMVTVLMLPLVMVAFGAGAQNLGQYVSINGFGTWAYGSSDGNYYLFSGPDGEYENMSAALTFIGKPYEDVTIFVQPNFEYSHEDFEVELGFAFVDWEITENFHLRAGRVRHPFGIYTEIFDVGTLRPFLNLPSAMYAGKTVARAYNGLGINGKTFFGDAWGLEYDLYGGQIDLKSVLPGAAGGMLEDSVRNTFGGRLILMTPVQGLRFGVSAYSGEQEEVIDQEVTGTGGTQRVYALLAEYLDQAWSVRSEWSRFDDPSVTFYTFYLEIAYRLTEHWQMAGRWDCYDANLDLVSFGYPPAFQNMVEHEDLAVAINYWINPKAVFKLELHNLEGNRYGGPDDVMAAIMSGTFSNKTRAIQLGVNFSF